MPACLQLRVCVFYIQTSKAFLFGAAVFSLSVNIFIDRYIPKSRIVTIRDTAVTGIGLLVADFDICKRQKRRPKLIDILNFTILFKAYVCTKHCT